MFFSSVRLSLTQMYNKSLYLLDTNCTTVQVHSASTADTGICLFNMAWNNSEVRFFYGAAGYGKTTLSVE
ncbi:hypothetical protein DT73_19945 [Mangrovibacter sp. MFB070]|nr:hypothetical protein DT73_19945 [Mangrovibacter sp. MFB070]